MSGRRKSRKKRKAADQEMLRGVRFQWAHGTPAAHTADLLGLELDTVQDCYAQLDADLEELPDHTTLVSKQLYALRLRRAQLVLAIEFSHKQLSISESEADLSAADRKRYIESVQRLVAIEKDLLANDREIRGLLEQIRPAGGDAGANREPAQVTIRRSDEAGDPPVDAEGGDEP